MLPNALSYFLLSDKCLGLIAGSTESQKPTAGSGKPTAKNLHSFSYFLPVDYFPESIYVIGAFVLVF